MDAQEGHQGRQLSTGEAVPVREQDQPRWLGGPEPGTQVQSVPEGGGHKRERPRHGGLELSQR